jgi:N-acetyl-gamma-glutamyl-phosphate/LysW-gamma-L-alpha-aminoadipyl-6-phosphate reductase
MAKTIKAGIIGGTGYTGVVLLEVLIRHPNVELAFITTRQESLSRGYIHREHPNLYGLTDLKFSLYKPESARFKEVNERLLERARNSDVVFMCVPSGVSMHIINNFLESDVKIIDTSADFRLKDPALYKEFYKKEHPSPELLKKFVYGLPELHIEDIKKAKYIACPGCNSTAMILAGYPLLKIENFDFRITYTVMTGSSEAGSKPTRFSHHAERSGVTRPYYVKEHRHLAEVIQELGFDSSKVGASMFAVPMVRGVECIGNVYGSRIVEEKELWKAFRGTYEKCPFIRIRARKTGGPGSLPDTKYVRGSNFCDVGFFIDKNHRRIGVISAIDNLLKGDVGNAVQCMNIMFGLSEEKRLKDLVPSYLLE